MASGHHESQGSSYAHDAWGYGQQYNQAQSQHNMSPMHEYQGFDYGQTALPMETTYAMPRPPPYAPIHHPLPPLVMPQNGVWPSMLTSQNNYQAPMVPASAALIQTPVSAAPSHGSDVTPTSAKSTNSRRKLTDDERRQMCLEAELNPTMKQTQIGAKFNVERSTVSKILRQKEKYMKPLLKEEAPSPGKKSKVKLPDVERTLANWARNQSKKGIPVTDEELRKQAQMFAAGRNDVPMLANPQWLENFKRKHLEGDVDQANLETPVDASPESSNGMMSPPISSADDRAPTLPQIAKVEDGFDFETKGLSYDESDLQNQIISSGDAIISPISPDLGRSDGLAVELSGVHPPQFNFSRQRSQTFPHLPEAVGLIQPAATMKAPPMPARSSSNANFRDTSVDPRHMMKRHKSVPDIHEAETAKFAPMQPPPLPKSADISPISNPGSPSSQDDNIRALYSIKQLLQQRPDVAEPDDYVMIGKLLEKLKLLRSPTGTPLIPHGLLPMEFSDGVRMSKKRPAVGISD